MFRASASDKPKFKGKAADTKHSLPITLEMLSKCFPLKSVLQRAGGLEPDDITSVAAENARRHLLLWTVLKQECQDPLLWCLYPKHHLFLHTVEGAASTPRLEWNSGDESEIGAAVKVAVGCKVAHLPVALMQRCKACFDLA